MTLIKKISKNSEKSLPAIYVNLLLCSFSLLLNNLQEVQTQYNKIKNIIKFYIDYIFDIDRNYLRSYKIDNPHFNNKCNLLIILSNYIVPILGSLTKFRIIFPSSFSEK